MRGESNQKEEQHKYKSVERRAIPKKKRENNCLAFEKRAAKHREVKQPQQNKKKGNSRGQKHQNTCHQKKKSKKREHLSHSKRQQQKKDASNSFKETERSVLSNRVENLCINIKIWIDRRISNLWKCSFSNKETEALASPSVRLTFLLCHRIIPSHVRQNVTIGSSESKEKEKEDHRVNRKDVRGSSDRAKQRPKFLFCS